MEKHTLEFNQDQIEYLFDILTAEAQYREPSEDNYDISDKDFENLNQKVFLKTLSYKKYAEGNF
tara:strand:+ start:2095 stop:2286 length:192 start_codon:yes stop_codon:yes gene_type:complete